MLTLGQAAKETGKTKTAIANAVNKGWISAIKNERGQYQIDPAELFRVYPPKSQQIDETIPPETTTLQREIELLREQLAREQEINRRLFDKLDEEAAERRKLTALLTHQPEKKPEAAPDPAKQETAKRSKKRGFLGFFRKA